MERTEKEKVKARFDEHVTKKPFKPPNKTNKAYTKESQIKDKLQNKFNGRFQFLELHTNSAPLLNLRINP